jgi:hypothetical protein
MKIHREEGGTLQSVRQIGTMAFAAAVMAFATGLSHASPIWEANFDQGTNLSANGIALWTGNNIGTPTADRLTINTVDETLTIDDNTGDASSNFGARSIGTFDLSSLTSFVATWNVVGTDLVTGAASLRSGGGLHFDGGSFGDGTGDGFGILLDAHSNSVQVVTRNKGGLNQAITSTGHTIDAIESNYSITATINQVGFTVDVVGLKAGNVTVSQNWANINNISYASLFGGDEVFMAANHQAGASDDGRSTYTLDQMVLIPEPGTLTLVGLAGLGLLASMLKRRRS